MQHMASSWSRLRLWIWEYSDITMITFARTRLRTLNLLHLSQRAIILVLVLTSVSLLANCSRIAILPPACSESDVYPMKNTVTTSSGEVVYLLERRLPSLSDLDQSLSKFLLP